MITADNDHVVSIINSLGHLIRNAQWITASEQIRNAQWITASEQYSPSSPDDSDERIREAQHMTESLRHIREQFENLVTGYIPPARHDQT